jgi:hypothetical protein
MEGCQWLGTRDWYLMHLQQPRRNRRSETHTHSGSNVSMIKRSALPEGIITKLLGDANLVRTLAGCLKTQEVITMQDIRLPQV